MTATATDVPFTIEQGGAPNVAVVRCEIDSVEGWEQWVLCRTDAHWDNPDCNREREKRHLDEAVRRGAAIIDNGDLFCAMQGKYDKRSDKSKVRPEHNNSQYLDSLVTTAVDYYAPYARNFVQIGEGNHETSIRDRHETHLTERLIGGLNARGGQILNGGYSGWVAFHFVRAGTHRITRRLWRIHGYGGGGPVTGDMIQSARQMAYVHGADVMFTGHTHDYWYRQQPSLTLNKDHVPTQRISHYIKGGSYKDEYKTGKGGWHVGTGKPPKPNNGAWWVRFYWAEKTVQIQILATE